MTHTEQIENILHGNNITKKSIENVNFGRIVKILLNDSLYKYSAFIFSVKEKDEPELVKLLLTNNYCDKFIKFDVTWQESFNGYKILPTIKTDTLYLILFYSNFLSSGSIDVVLRDVPNRELGHCIEKLSTRYLNLCANDNRDFMGKIYHATAYNICDDVKINNLDEDDMNKLFTEYLKLEHLVDGNVVVKEIYAYGNIKSETAKPTYKNMMFI